MLSSTLTSKSQQQQQFTKPASSSLTIRLKHHKTTTILHVPPTAPFSSVKTELLRALRQTHPDGRLRAGDGALASMPALARLDPAGGVEIPSDPSEVLLARPRDPLDASAGWVALPTTAEEAEAAAEAAGLDAVKAFATVKEAGLKDGAVLAFRFKGHGRASGGAPAARARGGQDGDEGLGMEEEDEEDGGGASGDEELLGQGADEEWDVVLPSYEDSTGVVNEGDVGALKNYTG